ncbi:F-box only protein 7-like [Tubulanus polymorphus]|uniref:F-box only protein 7-like n=1 Tax=Tubulanus polymorphus TaxID=672921 RepID=UPI003DA5E5C9
MKLRVKYGPRRIVIDIEGVSLEECTLMELKKKVSTELSLPVESFELSLNGTDQLLGEDVSLANLGIVAGDMVTVLSTVEPPKPNTEQSLPTITSPDTQNEDPPSIASTATDEQTSQSQQAIDESLPSTSSDLQAMDICQTPPPNDPVVNRYLKEPMLCYESVDGGTLPQNLVQLYQCVQPTKKQEALCIVINALMIEKGFAPKVSEEDISDTTGSVIAMPMMWNQMSSVYTLQFTHSSCYGVTAAVTCVPMGDIAVIHGIVRDHDQPKCKIQLKCSHYVLTVRKDPTLVYTGLAKLSRAFKDAIAEPLLENMRTCVGLDHTGGISGLAHEIKLHVLQFLDARSLVRMSGVNKEFLPLCREKMLWRRLYLRSFGSRSDNSLNQDWIQFFKEAVRRRKQMREMSRRYYPVVPPFRGPHPHFPHQPFGPMHPLYGGGGIVGGDYDRMPGGFGQGGYFNPVFGYHDPPMHPRFDPFGPMPDQEFFPGRGGGMFDGPPNGHGGMFDGPPNGHGGMFDGPPNGHGGMFDEPPHGHGGMFDGPPHGRGGMFDGPPHGHGGMFDGPPHGHGGMFDGPPHGHMFEGPPHGHGGMFDGPRHHHYHHRGPEQNFRGPRPHHHHHHNGFHGNGQHRGRGHHHHCPVHHRQRQNQDNDQQQENDIDVQGQQEGQGVNNPEVNANIAAGNNAGVENVELGPGPGNQQLDRANVQPGRPRGRGGHHGGFGGGACGHRFL